MGEVNEGFVKSVARYVTLLEVRGQLEDIQVAHSQSFWEDIAVACFIFFFVFFFSKIYSTDSELWDMDLEAT